MSEQDKAGSDGSRKLRGAPSAGYGTTVQLNIRKDSGALVKIIAMISGLGADMGSTPVLKTNAKFVTRSLQFNAASKGHAQEVVDAIAGIEGVEILHVSDDTLRKHEGGKIEIALRHDVTTDQDLGEIYTPGVADVCMAIHEDPQLAWTHTMKGTTIAVVTDGSRVLGLGNIGAKVPESALPVMEGKSALEKKFGGVNAFPLVLRTQTTESIVRTVQEVSPNFGAIHLEDIASPRCYDVEDQLVELLDIPVFHDDQHGTAIAVLAATINAAKLVKKRLRDLRVVGAGVGAAGLACAKLLIAAGVRHYVGYNINGAVHRKRTDLNTQEQWLAEHSNPCCFDGTIQEALENADLFLGLAAPGIIKPEDLKVMRRDPIVFALSNPKPDVDPIEAKKYARIVATGGSDYPNQINNALVFPGVFKGVLRARATRITMEMKIAAGRALAAVLDKDELTEEHIIPSIFHPDVAKGVEAAVIAEATRSGLSRQMPGMKKLL